MVDFSEGEKAAPINGRASIILINMRKDAWAMEAKESLCERAILKKSQHRSI